MPSIARTVGIKLSVVFIIMSTIAPVDIHQIVYIRSTQENALVTIPHLHDRSLVVTSAINRGILLPSVATCLQPFRTIVVVVLVVVAAADIMDVERRIVSVVPRVTTPIIQLVIPLIESFLH